MIEPNPGGGNLHERKRFKVYCTADENYAKRYDDIFKTKQDKSDCCGSGVKVIYPVNKPKHYQCKNCGKECKIKDM